jgi:ribosome-binding factor A
MKYKRSERVGELIREEISNLLLLEIKDPRIGFVTITQVELSDDLKNAKIFVSVMADEKGKEKALEGLSSASRFIKKELGRKLRLKITPELIFKIDNSLDYSLKIQKALMEISEKDKE